MVIENQTDLLLFVEKAKEILTLEINIENPDDIPQIRTDALTIALGAKKFAESLIVYDESDGMQLFWQPKLDSFERICVYVKKNSHVEIYIHTTPELHYESIPVAAVIPLIMPELEMLFAKMY